MEHLPIIDMHLHALELSPGESDAPATPEQYRRDTLALLEKLNIRGVTSGPKDLVRQWRQAG